MCVHLSVPKEEIGTISVFLLRVISFCFIKIFLAISYVFWIAKPIIICSVMGYPEVSEPSFYWGIIIIVTQEKIIWISHEVLFAGNVIKINLCLYTPKHFDLEMNIMNIRCKNVNFGKKSLLDCEIFMTKKFLPSCAFLSLMLNTEFLKAFFSRL